MYARALTAMFSWATSMPAAFVSAVTPPFDAPYMPFSDTAVMSLVTDDMFTIAPAPLARMARISCFTHDKSPTRLVASGAAVK
jgi:hypothetical protein